jgi:predicted transcriptional regulator of viral defense system
MNYLLFRKSLEQFPVFSSKDIKKQFSDFDNRRLVEWQEKGYIIKLRRGYYCFEDTDKGEFFRYFSANKIYPPSYISLQSALSYYNLIPEGVFTTTSLTTRNTTSFSTPVGNFTFRNIKAQLFFGYRLLNIQGHIIKIAEPEKSVLDHLYLNKIDTPEMLEGTRLNKPQLLDLLDFNKLNQYQELFHSKILQKRLQLLKKMIDA